jgi:hypothetical protein
MAKGWSTTTAGIEGEARLSKEWISSASLFLFGYTPLSFTKTGVCLSLFPEKHACTRFRVRTGYEHHRVFPVIL